MSLVNTLLKYGTVGVPDRVFLKAVPSGLYVVGGDTLNLNPGSWLDPKLVGVFNEPFNLPVVPPSVFSVVGMTGASVGTYAQVVPGLTLGTYKLQILGPGGAELTAAAYPAGVLTGYFVIEVEI